VPGDSGCDATHIMLTPTDEELAADKLDADAVDLLTDTMKRCGVVGISPGLSQDHVQVLHDAVEKELRPIIESRQRVKDTLTRAFAANLTLEELVDGSEGDKLCAEPVLAKSSGYGLAERTPGRLDYLLPWRPPFNDTWLTVNPLVLPLISALFGPDLQAFSKTPQADGPDLKSIRVIYALPGAPMQDLHQDTKKIFADIEWDKGIKRDYPESPVHTPPYALNFFIPLVDMHEEGTMAGPTQFALGTHRWSDAALHNGTVTTLGSFREQAGHFILADYRTVHRGLSNQLSTPRPVVMLLYGRGWWNDHTDHSNEVPVPGEKGALRRILRAKRVAREGRKAQCLRLLQARLQNAWKSWQELPKQPMPPACPKPMPSVAPANHALGRSSFSERIKD